MASPRVSMLYSTDMDSDDGEEAGHGGDGRTALDRTIDRIGMGSYQWALLSLCGFGWMADNMWLQAIAIILPRVQDHYSISDQWIGTLSASMFAGMMAGSIGWGTCSDLLGRSAAFNLTLCFTSLFGILASFVNSFGWLCIVFFFLGSAVGGSMPTDGTLLLENIPQKKQYLLTFLSIFFSFGAVASALISIIIIPRNSCLQPLSPENPCDMDSQNRGWRYVLMILGGVTLGMFICRIVFFRLHESPKFLVHAGRKQEAVLALGEISRFNGQELDLDLDDVEDTIVVPPARIVVDSPIDGDSYFPPVPRGRLSAQSERDYQSTDSSPTPPLNGQTFETPFAETPVPSSSQEDAEPKSRPSSLRRQRQLSSASAISTHSVLRKRSWLLRSLPRWLRKPLEAWIDRVKMLLTSEWRRTTLLVWGIWFSMSLAYTMFNVFLPKLLEARVVVTEDEQPPARDARKKLEETMWDVVIFTLGGCPGAVLGAYATETPLGRRLTLALSTFVTAIFCVFFAQVESKVWIWIAEVGVSLSATTMWAVLYGMTPAMFSPKVRGTACGTASALSRIGGILAPLVGGPLLAVGPSLPVYTSVVIFLVACVGVLALKEDESSEDDRGAYEPVH